MIAVAPSHCEIATKKGMGRLGHELVVVHFSHPHPLELTSLHQQPATTCAGCSRTLSDRAYSCKACGYALHVSCAQMPQRVRHPADASHSLTLLPSGGGSFSCNACGADGSAFFYHCGECDLNLHCSCAALPLSVVHAAHLHPLTLFFFPPYENRGFSCDVCGHPGSYQWVYSCAMCGFDAHVGCATAAEEEAQANHPWHGSEGGGSAPHLALQKMETGVGVRKIDKRKAKRLAKRIAITAGTSLICTIL
ncbi:hypothetical protein BHM03_00008094 [Ensete ventricosum]|uniref:Phorbol-ester/DAG-type domain-containing protein n=1 Tax=Ensete ventricosum TaxID=4639 RepID=A0A426ZUF6_ENSVE|nr:hypothetical protein B296_00017621 [Ensete ventricosum]RZR81795.1 hypothetical protein BHM03_00008094 [Ensete ventricosum]